MEAPPLADVTAETVSRAFMDTWVSRFGVPLFVITDSEKQFENAIFQQLAKTIGYHTLRITAHHQRGNGFLQRRHRVLKAVLMARQGDWLSELPVMLMGMRMMPAENGLSPFSAATGTELVCPRVTTSNHFNCRAARVREGVGQEDVRGGYPLPIYRISSWQ